MRALWLSLLLAAGLAAQPPMSPVVGGSGGGGTGPTGATGATGPTGATGATGANGASVCMVTLTATDLEAINTTPVTACPALGANRMYFPLNAVQQTLTGAAYTVYGDLKITLRTLSNQWYSPSICNSTLSSVLDTDAICSSLFAFDAPLGTKASFADQPLTVEANNSASNGRIAAYTINAAGTNFQVADAVCTQTGSPVACYTVATLSGSGIATLATVSQGQSVSLATGVLLSPSFDSGSTFSEAGIRTAVQSAGVTAGYVTGDTVSVDAYSGSVLTVTAVAGSVTAVALTTRGSSGTAGSSQATTTLTGIGTGLLVDTTILGSGATMDITAIQSVSGGGGSVVISIPYTVVTTQ